MMQTITSLRPNMSHEHLLRTVLPTSAAGRLRALASPVRGVADVYVPFYLCRVEIANGTRCETSQLAVDAVNGGLDPYLIGECGEFVDVRTRNCVPVVLSSEDVECAAVEKVRRTVFDSSFFAIRDLRISASADRLVYVPYWLVMLGSERDLRLKVFDAVRCRPEGAKMRTMLREWLAG
jgi:hypothetical protein